MENNINNKNENRNETSIDHQLICTICNKSFNDPQSFSCDHTCCRQCITQKIEGNYVSCPICQQVVTINNFPEVNHSVSKNVNELSMEHNEDKQTILSSQNIDDRINKASSNITLHKNEQQNQCSTPRLFEPFRNLLSDIINQNTQLREEMNQLKKQNQLQLNEQSKKIEDHQHEIKQLKNQSQLQQETLTEQLNNVNNQYDLCVKQLNEQSKKNEEHQLELDQLKKQCQLHLIEQSKKNEEHQLEIKQLKKQSQLQLTEQSRKNGELQRCITQLYANSVKYRTDINRLQTNDQNRNTKIREIDQRHNLLVINVESLRPIMKYLDTKWKQDGITTAGGNGNGNKLNQLSFPTSISINDEQTIYIADCLNHRIVEWKCNATNGRIVAGGNGKGNQTNQLNYPNDVIIDNENNFLIISDWQNRRVMRWSLRNNTENGEIIMSNIDCSRLTMDKDGSLYVSNSEKDEVRRWKRRDQNGTIVAGGNGKGNHLNQLNHPTFIFVDEDYSLYVSDRDNHRVMKWAKGAKEGRVVVGGNGEGNSLTQLSKPRGVIVNQLGKIYVADRGNHRVMGWWQGAKEGTIVVGGNGEGQQSNQFNCPNGLSFDRQGNLYVSDGWNHRIQKFEIN